MSKTMAILLIVLLVVGCALAAWAIGVPEQKIIINVALFFAGFGFTYLWPFKKIKGKN